MADETKDTKIIELPANTTVRDLADKLGSSPIDIIKVLMAKGFRALQTTSPWGVASIVLTVTRSNKGSTALFSLAAAASSPASWEALPSAGS